MIKHVWSIEGIKNEINLDDLSEAAYLDLHGFQSRISLS